MEVLAIISSGVAVVAVVALALLYGKYRGDAKVAKSWETLAKVKENYATSLKKQLADREEALRAATYEQLRGMSADQLAERLRRMYAPPGRDSHNAGGSVPPAPKAGPGKS